MALFKISRGDSANLASVPFHDGWAYFTPNDAGFYFDALFDDGHGSTINKRIRINSYEDVDFTGAPTADTIITIKGLEEIIDIDDSSDRIINSQWINYALNQMTSIYLEQMSIACPPNKIEYNKGECFDPTGIEVVGIFDDGSVRYITDRCTFTPDATTPLTLEDASIKVSCDGVSCYQMISVKPFIDPKKESDGTLINAGFYNQSKNNDTLEVS